MDMDMDMLIARARRGLAVADVEAVVETFIESGIDAGDAFLAVQAALIIERDAALD